MQELYSDNYIRSFTPYGKTAKTNMRRGIRQGCPLSPLLFAYYINPVAIEMEKINPRPGQEPAVLMYADDIVIWGETEKEMQLKLQKLHDTMQSLGLQMSFEKTELQCNKHTTRTETEDGIQIQTEEGNKQIPYQATDKPLRYLGYWTTTDLNTDHGIELMQEKMEEKLNQIRGKKMTPSARALLIRSKVVSIWNYTTAVQTVDESIIKKWNGKIYDTLTQGEFRKFRTDLV